MQEITDKMLWEGVKKRLGPKAKRTQRIMEIARAAFMAAGDALNQEHHEMAVQWRAATDELGALRKRRALSQAKIDKLALDVAMMNGRLQERTETMLERQKAWADRARKAEAVLGRVLPELKAAWPVVSEAALADQNDAQEASEERRPVLEERYAAKSAERSALSRRMVHMVHEIEGLLGDGVDRTDRIDEAAAAAGELEGGAR